MIYQLKAFEVTLLMSSYTLENDLPCEIFSLFKRTENRESSENTLVHPKTDQVQRSESLTAPLIAPHHSHSGIEGPQVTKTRAYKYITSLVRL